MGTGDDSSNKLNRFADAVSRGERGEVGNFDLWLEELGHDSGQVHVDKLTAWLRENPQYAVDQEDAIETIGEYVGFVRSRSVVFHIPLIGPDEIGKSQLLHTAIHLVAEFDEKADTVLLNAETFGNRRDDRFVLDEEVDRVQQLDSPIVCIDDAHRDKRIGTSLEAFNGAVQSGLILTAWTPEGFSYYREAVNETFEPADLIRLNPFTTSATETLVDRVMGRIDAPEAFPAETVERIHEYSDGFPGLTVRLIVRSLHEAFLDGLDPGSVESVDAAADRMGLREIEQRVEGLTQAKLDLLRWILLDHHPQGVQPGELVDKLGRDKSTISYHLRDLRDARLVEANRDGRRAFYSVNPVVKPFVQRRIDEEGEYHA